MPPELVLEEKIGALRRRIRLLNALHWSCALALYAGVVCLALLIASKFHWVEVYPEYVAGMIAASAAVGGAIGYLRRVTAMETARRTDARLDLKERLSSALEFGRGEARHPLVDLQIADAAAHSERIEPKSAYPIGWPRDAMLLGIVLAAVVLLTVIPQLAVFQSPRERIERAALKKQGEEIVRVAKETQKRAEVKKMALARELSRNLETLGKDMMRNRITKKQALLQMHKLTKQMAEAQMKLQATQSSKKAEEALKAMKKAADSMPENMKNTDFGKLMKQMAEAAEKKDFQKAQDAAKKLAEQAASGKMTPEQKKQASEQLKKMASALKGSPTGDAASKMAKAADAAARGDMKEASKQASEAMKSAQAADQKMAESQELQKMSQAMQSGKQEMQMAQQPGEGKGKKSGKDKQGEGGDSFSAEGIAKGGSGPPGGGDGNPRGMSGPDAGHGTTNKRSEWKQMGAGGSRDRQKAGLRPGMHSKFEQIYAPERIATTPLDTKVKGKIGNKGNSTFVTIRGAPDSATAREGYASVSGDYHHAAESALAKEDIPPAYRGQVKSYFESLK